VSPQISIGAVNNTVKDGEAGIPVRARQELDEESIHQSGSLAQIAMVGEDA